MTLGKAISLVSDAYLSNMQPFKKFATMCSSMKLIQAVPDLKLLITIAVILCKYSLHTHSSHDFEHQIAQQKDSLLHNASAVFGLSLDSKKQSSTPT